MNIWITLIKLGMENRDTVSVRSWRKVEVIVV